MKRLLASVLLASVLTSGVALADNAPPAAVDTAPAVATDPACPEATADNPNPDCATKAGEPTATETEVQPQVGPTPAQ